MTTVSNQDMKQKVGMRPTLLIGLGGTGQKVLVQLKARFLRNYGMIPRDIRFLSFDTDQTAEKTQYDGKPISLTSDTELINVGGIEPLTIMQNLDRYPAIASWITEDKERIPARAITMGAKQIRPLGRLSLFWRIEVLFKKISEAVDSLTKLDENPSEQRGVNVFIVSSVCGGTGSGAILDVAYLARHAIERSGLPSSHCFINAILALPSAFPNVDQIGISSNAYACLTEIDHFFQTMDWCVDYGNPVVGQVQFSGVKPFNICYLIGGRNEDGKGLTGLEEIAPMIAEAVYLQVCSQVGRAQDSVFDNVTVLANELLDHSTQRRRPTAYSSFGTASMVFPASRIIETCSHRMGAELIKTHLLGQTIEPAQVDAAVKSFMQSNQLEIEALLLQIGRDAKDNLIRINIDPRALDKLNEKEIYGGMQQYLSRLETQVDNEYTQHVETNRKAASEMLADSIDKEVIRLADDPSFGLPFTVAFLSRLDETLASTRGELDKSREAMEQRRDRIQTSLRQTSDAVSSSIRSSFIGRGKRIQEARNRHVASFNEFLTARFETRKREAAIAVLASMNSKIQTRRSEAQGAIDQLEFIQTKFENYGDRTTGSRNSIEFILASEITTEEDINRFYNEHLANLGSSPTSLLLEAQGPMHEWIGTGQADVTQRILNYARGVFDDINRITLESEIQRKRDTVDVNKRLQDAISRSVPFWNYRSETMGQHWQSQKILVTGVYNRENSIYQNFRSSEEGTQESLISTFDPHTIMIVQTKHGLPLFGLNQFMEYKQHHDTVIRNNIKPLYVFPEVRPGGEKAKQMFALGVVYGMIFKSGTFYYSIPSDQAMPLIPLGQGLDEALRQFRSSEDLFNQITEMIEDEISKSGRAAANSIVNEFIQNCYVYEVKIKGGTARATGGSVDQNNMTKDTSPAGPNSSNFNLMMELRESVKGYQKTVLNA